MKGKQGMSYMVAGDKAQRKTATFKPSDYNSRWDLGGDKEPNHINWIKNLWYIYTIEYYAAIKKNEVMSFAATWMELEVIILSELMQEQKTRYWMFSLISGS